MKLILEVEDKTAALLELGNILIQLRDHTKYWEEHYGAIPKKIKKYWEKRADEWILKHIKKEEEE